MTYQRLCAVAAEAIVNAQVCADTGNPLPVRRYADPAVVAVLRELATVASAAEDGALGSADFHQWADSIERGGQGD